MAMTLEQADQLIDQLLQQVNQLNTQVTQLTTRSTSADEEHKQVHAELVRTQAQLAHINTRGGKAEFRLIDPKTMTPEKLGTGKGPRRQWAEDARADVAMLSPTLAQRLKRVEGLEAKLTRADVDAAAVPEHHAAQMTRYLSLRSERNANTIIKASMERNEHPLETWSILSWEHDPKGLGFELVDLSDIVSPITLRAKSLPEISMAIESWEAMERRHTEGQGIELPRKSASASSSS